MNFHWPKIVLPCGFKNVESYLRYLVEEGARRKYGVLSSVVSERIDFELQSLKGYEPYFLIIHDIVEYCTDNNIFLYAVSNCASSSIVNYCLGITKVDPVKWKLPFEMFFLKTKMDCPVFELNVGEGNRRGILHHLR